MNMAMTDAPITSKGSSASMPFASSAIASASKKPGAYFFRVCIWVFFLSFQHTGRQRKICLTTGSSPIIYEDPRLVKYPHSFIGMCPRYFIAKTYPQDRKLISYPYALSIALRSSRWYDHIMIASLLSHQDYGPDLRFPKVKTFDICLYLSCGKILDIDDGRFALPLTHTLDQANALFAVQLGQ